MLTHIKLDHLTDVTWAVPTSGFGHVADEQPLPYVLKSGMALTPMFGGESGHQECGWQAVGIPSGVLANGWPWRQRLFNLPRRTINLYWRNVFVSRCRADGAFNFGEQLGFSGVTDGFDGICPLIRFSRRFSVSPGRVQVSDIIEFRRSLSFAHFRPVVVPLFPEWGVNSEGFPRLEIPGTRLLQTGRQRSAAGNAILWAEVMEQPRFKAGDRLARTYSYCWSSL